MKPLHQLSRQRLWQIKQQKQGKCVICAKPLVTKTHCQIHADSQRKRQSGHPKRQYRTKYSEPPGLHIGGTIRTIRLEKGLSAGVVAEQLGIVQPYYSKIEYNDSITWEKLKKLAQIFGMKLSRLIQRHEERMGL